MRRFFLLALLLLLSFPAYADTISVRADIWCPCNCQPDSKRPGFAIEAIKAIFEKAGHKIDYQLTNWNRAIERARAGEFNAIVGATHHDAEDFVFPAEPVGISQTAFLTRAGDPFEYTDTSSLNDRVLGAILSYAYDADIDAYIAMHKDDPHRIDFATGDQALERNIDKLLAKRVDVIVDDASVMEYKMNELKMSNKMDIHRAKAMEKIYIAFEPKNPKSKEYADIFDKGMKELRDSGAYGEILKKYGLADWKK